MRALNSILVTGGAGFIGSNFIRHLFASSTFSGRVINLDKLTYAGNPENLEDVLEAFGGKRYFFEKADICDPEAVRAILRRYDIDTVVHFAAESHVDRSIFGPGDFIQTNIVGTFLLLEAVRELWGSRQDVLFHHVSTDEVFGSLEEGRFSEDSPYRPRSPYSASKASSDHLARAYFHTYGLPVTVSNCSNNYGPYQFPEKLIPLIILNMTEGKPLPIYGEGKNVRDWLYVEDHAEAVWQILKEGQAGETYAIGGDNEWENLRLVETLCDTMARLTGRDAKELRGLIHFVQDRPGHDLRYAIDCAKIKRTLGWSQGMAFERGLEATILWYLEHKEWVARVRSGDYRSWVERNYGRREASQ